jgi:DNA polymerase V
MLKFIPIAAQAGISGFESPAAQYKESGLDLDAMLIDHPSATYIGLAQGESMVGVGIYDNDLLIVSRAETARKGDVIVANLNGEFVCKIIDPDRRLLISASDAHVPHYVTDDDTFEIEGVVIRSVRLHRPLLTSR